MTRRAALTKRDDAWLRTYPAYADLASAGEGDWAEVDVNRPADNATTRAGGYSPWALARRRGSRGAWSSGSGPHG